MDKRTRKRRVAKVVALMHEVGENHFDMHSFKCLTTEKMEDQGTMEGFNREYTRITSLPQGEAIHACGTTACIAGFASIASEPKAVWYSVRGDRVEFIGREFLGLSIEAAEELFYNFSATFEQAIRCLENYGETGVVDWNA